MSGPQLGQHCRTLLRAYPRSWRRHREEEMISTLLDQAAEEGRSRLSLRTAADLVGHGLEERAEVGLQRLPRSARERVALIATATALALSAVLLVNEVLGAWARPPADQLSEFSYFPSGPFLTVGVGIYGGWLLAAVLLSLGRGGWGRWVALTTTAYTLALVGPVGFTLDPRPRLLVLALFLGLGALALLARVPSRQTPRQGFLLSAVVIALSTVLAAVFLAYGPSWDLVTEQGGGAPRGDKVPVSRHKRTSGGCRGDEATVSHHKRGGGGHSGSPGPVSRHKLGGGARLTGRDPVSAGR